MSENEWLPKNEWLAIGIWEIVQDSRHNSAHMAVAQELKRLYRALGEPVSAPLTGIPDPRPAPAAARNWPPPVAAGSYTIRNSSTTEASCT